MTRFFVIATLASFFAAPVSAHIQLDEPPSRTDAQKTGPCGEAGSTRGDTVTTFEAGETIELKWRETVNHPGHYRVSFDDDGQDDFVDPAAFDDFDTAPSVMIDNIDDADGGDYSQMFTLPNEPCENCTIQVVQVMTDKAPYGDGNDLYYQCADIRIVPATNTDPDAGTSESDAGNNGAGNNGGSADAGTSSPGNNSTTGGPSGPDDPMIDDGYIDDGTSDDEPACSAAGGALGWPLLLLVGFVVRRRRVHPEVRNDQG